MISSYSEQFARVKVGRVALATLVGIILVALLRVVSPRLSGATVLALLIYIVYALIAAAALRSCREAGIPAAEVFGPPPQLRDFVTALLFVPLLLTVALLTIWLTLFVLSWTAPGVVRFLLDHRQESLLVRNLAPGTSILLPLGIVVVGPAVEEFVFRGLLLRRWVARSGLWRGVVGSSLVFAVLHPQFLIGAFVIGVVLALLYLATRSLVTSILVHGVMNGVVLLVTFNRETLRMSGGTVTGSLAELRSGWGPPLVMLVLLGALLVAVVRPLAARAAAHLLPSTS